MFTILIKGGLVMDGSGGPGYRADLAVAGDRIEAIGAFPEADAEVVIDATGLAVAPGFIDMHTHSDVLLPFLPGADSKVVQGVTTEVTGNCGGSMAPLSPAACQTIRVHDGAFKPRLESTTHRVDGPDGLFNPSE